MWFCAGPESGNSGCEGGHRNAPTATVSLRKTTVSTVDAPAGDGRVQIADRVLVTRNILTAPDGRRRLSFPRARPGGVPRRAEGNGHDRCRAGASAVRTASDG